MIILEDWKRRDIIARVSADLFLCVHNIEILCNVCSANNHGMWSSYKDLHTGEFLRNLKIMKMDSVSLMLNTQLSNNLLFCPVCMN